MPTFSQNPHPDYYPSGPEMVTNGSFSKDASGWQVYPAGDNILTWQPSDKAPADGVSGGCSEIASTPAAVGAIGSMYPLGSLYPFTAADRLFAQGWIRVMSITNSPGPVRVRMQARLMTSAGGYLSSLNLATRNVAPADGWVRVWGTVTGAAMITQNASAARAGIEIYTDIPASPVGTSYVWRADALSSTFGASAAITKVLYADATGAVQAITLPTTVGPGPTYDALHQIASGGAIIES